MTRYLVTMFGRSHAGIVPLLRRYLRKLVVTSAKCASWPTLNLSGMSILISFP